VLRQIIINDQDIFALVTEIFRHRAAGIRSDIKHRGRRRSAGQNHGRIFHRPCFFQFSHDIGDFRLFLTDSDIDTFHVLPLLVDNGIDSNGRLAELAIADNEFTLAAANRNHGVNRFDAGLDRLAHAFAGDDARGDLFHRIVLRGLNLSFAVQSFAERVDHATNQARADWDFQNSLGRTHLIAFLDHRVITQNDSAHLALFEVEGDARYLAFVCSKD